MAISTPDLRSCPWRAVELPAATKRAPTMLLDEELQLLYYLGSTHFRNFGHIIDGGCFLGGSSIALAEGVRSNPLFQANPRGRVIHSYDLFEVEEWTIGIYFPKDTKPLSDFRHVHRQNTFMYEDVLDVRPGDVMTYAKFGDPIEVLFIDLAKHWTVCDFVTRSFFPSLIAGHSVVVQQDYLFGSHTAWLHVTMEYLAPYFEIVGDTNYNSVVFLNTKEIPADVLDKDIVQSLGQAEIKELSNNAIGRFEGHKRELLERSRDHFLGVLEQNGWKP